MQSRSLSNLSTLLFSLTTITVQMFGFARPNYYQDTCAPS
ncbi:unnamed protein product [Penicillium roqueforti FM164]|uniref:Integrase, catalytic core n=2 Tax=Penicillium TaxID=5073 RepID=A0A0G4PYG5_PENC3|nr:unnamed protein product [Penicillium roqueforti FM164]CRL31543.1 Integrase, catalytic core [Penicillium camemberti]